MRAYVLLAMLPLIAACEAEPAPIPEPRPTADPVVIKTEVDRTVLLSGEPGSRDFKVNFADPFIGFENRGGRMAVRQTREEPRYRVIDVSLSRDEGVTVFRSSEGAIPGGEPFVLTIIRADCKDEFTLERTGYVAWLGTASNPRQARTCASRAE